MTTNLYRQRLAEGKCGRCGGPSDNGRSECTECAKKRRIQQNQRYHSFLAQHKCGHCGRELPDKWYFVLCDICMKKQHARYSKNKEKV